MSAARQAHELIHRYLIEEAQASDVGELERLLLHSAEVADAFVDAAWFDALLQAAYAPSQPAAVGLLAAEEPSSTDSAEQPHLLAKTSREPNPVLVRSAANVPVASSCPGISLADQNGFGAAGYSFSGWPVAYLVATVIFGIGLVVGALVHVSRPMGVVEKPASLPSPLTPLPSTVARVTGMVDCVLNNDECRMQNVELQTTKTKIHPSSFITQHSPIHLGDRLALKSGLLEITYDTGAKVILQGPVTYEVESAAGGYLSLGKLTARLEKGSGISANPKRQRGAGGKDDSNGSANPLTSDLCPLTSGLFAVRTPTAIVTDLGTEFGVEVDASGATRSQVFRGSVAVRVLSGRGGTREREHVLHENEATRIERDDQRAIVVVPALDMAHFVREMPKQAVKMFDLVDVVAGGDGFSGKRGRGINPTNGKVQVVQARRVLDVKDYAAGDGAYHRVETVSCVDGVFIPNGGLGPMPVDSAGHLFFEFPATANCTEGYIWAGGIFHADPPFKDVPAVLGGIDYASPGHGAIYLQSCQGITFDLDAIRRVNPGQHIVRFSATAGNTETVSERGQAVCADLWVLVDGEVRFRRRAINAFNGAIPIVIPLSEHARFLTLASTDGGDGIAWDWILFGDPRLELASVASDFPRGLPLRQERQ